MATEKLSAWSKYTICKRFARRDATGINTCRLPLWQAEGLIEGYAHYSRGEASAISSAVLEVTGKTPRDFKTFVNDYAGAFLIKAAIHNKSNKIPGISQTNKISKNGTSNKKPLQQIGLPSDSIYNLQSD